MPKRVVAIISLVCVMLGFMILGLSLILTSPAYRVGEEGKVNRTFYIKSEILPDHILYPAFNLQDRVALVLAKDQDRDLVRVGIAQKRLREAQALQTRNPSAEILIVRTLEKSHHYLREGMEGFTAKRWDLPEKVIYVAEVLGRRRQMLTEILDNLSNDSYRAKVEAVIHEEDVIRQKLWGNYGDMFRELGTVKSNVEGYEMVEGNQQIIRQLEKGENEVSFLW